MEVNILLLSASEPRSGYSRGRAALDNGAKILYNIILDK